MSDTQNRKTRVVGGMLDFEYCASLHIEHRELEPDIVSSTLQRTPNGAHRAGEARQTPSGRPLKDTWPTGCWRVDLETRDGEDVAQFLDRIVNELSPHRDFLRKLVEDGGKIECFMGLFAKGLCDQILPCHLLQRLGEYGIDLRLDYYK